MARGNFDWGTAAEQFDLSQDQAEHLGDGGRLERLGTQGRTLSVEVLAGESDGVTCDVFECRDFSPTVWRMFLLVDEPRSANQLRQHTGLQPSTIRSYMSKLKKDNLVKQWSDGRWAPDRSLPTTLRNYAALRASEYSRQMDEEFRSVREGEWVPSEGAVGRSPDPHLPSDGSGEIKGSPAEPASASPRSPVLRAAGRGLAAAVVLVAALAGGMWLFGGSDDADHADTVQQEQAAGGEGDFDRASTDEEKAWFISYLESHDPAFEGYDRDRLLELGEQVCEMLDSTDRESAIELIDEVSTLSQMSSARLVVGAQRTIC